VIRDSIRSIARAPLLSAVIVVSLGAGIGVNTVIFSWIQTRLLKPLAGVAGSADFHWVESRTDTGVHLGVSWPEYEDLRARLHAFRDLLAFRSVPLYLGEAGQVERAYGLLVSDNYFTALGLQAEIGRFPTSTDDPAIVISYGLWRTRFGADPGVLGRTLRVNGSRFAIAAVAPREFQGTTVGLNFEVWLPAALAPELLKGSRELVDRGVRGCSVMGKLRHGATLAQAQADLDGVMAQLARAYPQTNATLQGQVLPFMGPPRGPMRLMLAGLAVLQGVMLLLLLAVCGNTANLVLARASARQREMGVRLALGAGPWRIAGLLLTENVLLGLAGAGLGAIIAVWGTPALVTLPLSGMPIRFQTSVDGFGLAFAMVLGVACGLAAGSVPAAQLARIDPQAALRAGARTAGRSGLRHALMSIQVGLALVVLILAGLSYRSVTETRGTDTGFRREGVLLAAYDLTGRTTGQAASRTFAARLLAALRGAPGIDGAAIASSVPLEIHGLPSRAFTIEGRARTAADADRALVNTVTPGYFEVMGIPILAGTDFADLNDAVTPPQAIVNEAFVRRYLDNALPLGRRITVRGRTLTVAAVVRNSLYNAFGERPTPIVYFSYRDMPSSAGEVHVRTGAGSESVAAQDLRRVVRELDAELPLFNVRTLTDHIETNLVFRRVPARLFTVLGPLLLMLAAIGIYAVVSYTVSLRTTEIGVRIALGATVRGLIAQFVGESLVVAGLGALVGWALSLAVAIVIAGDQIDVPVFAGVPAILLLVAAIACWIPVRRATRISPMAALREEP
jgi:putative ABC transport system permease protein